MSLPLSLTGVGSTWYVPQTLIEVKFAQGTVLGDPTTKNILLIGPKTSSGSATTAQVYGPDTLTSEADVVSYFGAGSPVHRMWRRITDVCKTAPIYAIAPAESSGTAASTTVVFATTATANGVISYTIGGETMFVPITTGDTATVIGAAFAAEINRRTWLPVTASNSTGTVTLTNKLKGTNGNWVRHRGSIVQTSGTIATTITLAAAVPSNGATDETYTLSLAAILAEKYDYIVPGINPTAMTDDVPPNFKGDARMAALSAQIQTQKLPTSGIRQQIITATAD
jgi:phage tail sheath gpL-like